MVAPFSTQQGGQLGSGQDQIIVGEDGQSIITPALILARRSTTPAAVPKSVGALLWCDPTTGMPFAGDPQGSAGPLLDSEPSADLNGFLGWSSDPAANGNSTILTTSATIILIGVRVAWPTTITNVHICITVAGATLTTARNFLGLYNSAGQLLGTSADQTIPFASAGLCTAALTTPAATFAGMHYVAVLPTGTTLPTLLAGAGLAPNNISVANLNRAVFQGPRIVTGPAAQTSLPASISIGTQSAFAAASWWAALS